MVDVRQSRPPSVNLLALPESSAAVLYGLFEVLSTFAESWSWLMDGETVAAGFDVRIVGRQSGQITCYGGTPVIPHATLSQVDDADIVIVTDLAVDPRSDHRQRWSDIGPWLKRMHEGGAMLCSVCSGSVLLAGAGLLDGQPATTHWGYVDHFRCYFPSVALQPERILLPAGADGRIVTTGGMAAWEDLALYLIARFHGDAAAVKAAKLYLFGDRSEGQMLYAARRLPRRIEDKAVAAAQAWIAGNYTEPDCLQRMAAVSGLSPRTFTRRFRSATGLAPLNYLQTLRVEEAKHLLETTAEPVNRVVESVGYDDAASFRRLFRRQTGVTPSRYRQRFRQIGCRPR